YLLYGIPLIASAVSIWFIVSSRTMELPVSWADWLTNLAKRASDNWTAFKLWLARRTSGQGA
ncbi:LPS export ABC transporter permease LptF, partial [Mesorhizobium sp. M2A.F.Ca.ET.037.01.1.1]